MTKEEIIKDQFPNDKFLQSSVLQIVDKCTAELEKENAELKKKNLTTQDAVTMQIYTNKANKEIAYKQLNKAKEIMQNLLDVAKFYSEHRDKSTLMDVTPIYEAEQFLKEKS